MRTPRFLIISEPRTGSNNVSYVLGAHPQLEVGNELLHPRNGIKPEEFPELAGRIGEPAKGHHWITTLAPDDRALVCTRLFEQHNGFKIHNQHVPASLIGEIAAAFDCRIILTTRVDIFAQAISNALAVHGGKWHADERDADGPLPTFTLPPRWLLTWLDDLVQARRQVWETLAPMADRVFVCQYEVFFAGTKDARLLNFLHLLDFLGVPRFGQLPQAEMAASLKRAMHFIDPQQQKITQDGAAADRITNYDDVRQKYQVWTMRSFGKLAVA